MWSTRSCHECRAAQEAMYSTNIYNHYESAEFRSHTKRPVIVISVYRWRFTGSIIKRPIWCLQRVGISPLQSLFCFSLSMSHVNNIHTYTYCGLPIQFSTKNIHIPLVSCCPCAVCTSLSANQPHARLLKTRNIISLSQHTQYIRTRNYMHSRTKYCISNGRAILENPVGPQRRPLTRPKQIHTHMFPNDDDEKK